jgi:hypothetical protein
MNSVVLLAAVACLLVVPGIAASLMAVPQGEVSVITRSALVFGLGYTVSAGCAFALAVAHGFRLAWFLALWVVVSAALWTWAVRTGRLRDQVRAIVADVSQSRLPLLLGAVVVAVLLVVHIRYVSVLGAPRYVYYLSGVQIANSHGVPATTLEYGQAWPPATDKIYLDSFTGVLVLLSQGTVTGPAVLLLVAAAGAAIGLWAVGWELGLRRAGVLLPVLYLGNTMLGDLTVGGSFTDYRAEDFGRAVAFCALAAGIAAIRERSWRLAVAAGLILAAASGTHLIPAVVTVLALGLAGLAELAREPGNRHRSQALLRLAGVGAVAGLAGVTIRVLAGGAFGLNGAENPGDYHTARAAFDPTAYLFSGITTPLADAHKQWYAVPSRVTTFMLTGSSHFPGWKLWLPVLIALLAAALLPLVKQLRPVAIVGLGMIVGTIAVAVLFSVSYSTYIEQTFGVRRLASFSALGLCLIFAGIAEAFFLLLDRKLPRLAAIVPALAVLGVAAWLLPTAAVSPQAEFNSQQRLALVNWVRTQTPCGARFLVNQRTEGTFTALTGRLALLEGMGPFLRTSHLPYVVRLAWSAKRFFRAPVKNEMFLRHYRISFIVAVLGFQELGYRAPIGPPDVVKLDSAPFLRRVFATRSIVVYQVAGSPMPAPSPLLRGPYLHCLTSPVRF